MDYEKVNRDRKARRKKNDLPVKGSRGLRGDGYIHKPKQ